jgi:hypothetical protein
LDEPSRSDHFCSEGLSPIPQLTIRCDERDLIGCIRGHVNEHVVATARRMEDRDAINNASFDSIASSPFEDYNNRLDEPARTQGCAQLLYELSRRSRPVTPPTGRTRAHDVGCIYEEH